MDKYNWDDIEPLSIEESSTPQLCHILYSTHYKQVMGYLRRLMVLNEYSERALYITEEAILLVAAHYTVWEYRFQIVKLLSRDIVQELEWCDDILLNNQKNYQIWHYRQLLIGLYDEETQHKSFNPALEFPLIETMLVEDNKNYHVWSYRKWLVDEFKLYNDQRELSFVNKMLEIDIRNNSAWNHRFFIVVNRTIDDDDALDIVDLELKFVKELIQQAPQNPSPWNYLQGLYNHFKLDLLNLEPFVKQFAELDTKEEEVENVIQSTHLFEILAKIYKLKDEKDKSIKIYQLLADKYDPIRVNYWNHLIKTV